MKTKTKIMMIVFLPLVITIWLCFLSYFLWCGLDYEFEHYIKPELLEQNNYDDYSDYDDSDDIDNNEINVYYS